MAKTNLTITLGNEDQNRLDYLVNFFQGKSISTVTKSDVIKFLIKRSFDILHNPEIDRIIESFEIYGINPNIEEIENILEELKELDQ